MATRLSQYRMQDGRTPLGQDYFNPIWADLDRRLDTIERLRVEWLTAVSELQAQGLARVDAVLVPLIADAQAQLAALVDAAAGLADVLVAADIRHFEPAVAGALTYDVQGRISVLTETLANAATRTTTYSYDGDGQVATAAQTVAGVARTTTYSYSDGKITGWTVAEETS